MSHGTGSLATYIGSPLKAFSGKNVETVLCQLIMLINDHQSRIVYSIENIELTTLLPLDKWVSLKNICH